MAGKPHDLDGRIRNSLIHQYQNELKLWNRIAERAGGSAFEAWVADAIERRSEALASLQNESPHAPADPDQPSSTGGHPQAVDDAPEE